MRPAIVRSAQIWVDGKPQTNWHHVLEALGDAKPGSYSEATINPDVLSTGEQVRIIKFSAKNDYQRFRTAAVGRVAINLCFCSSLDECWIYGDKHLVGYKVITSQVNPIRQCPRLPLADVFGD
ncbi:MAG: hypothetical protein M3R20_03850 [Pseudomonadota bacterium]|nr:hypothetical protein [Pseudomonadota bacterium]